MSTSKRVEKRELYMQGWYQMDAEMLLASTTAEFIFDDPAEPGPVTRDMLPGYMQRWDVRARAAGGENQWLLTHEFRRDENGILTDWEWWQLVGTELQGAALVLTADEGVVLERITYFDRTRRHSSPTAS